MDFGLSNYADLLHTLENFSTQAKTLHIQSILFQVKEQIAAKRELPLPQTDNVKLNQKSMLRES